MHNKVHYNKVCQNHSSNLDDLDDNGLSKIMFYRNIIDFSKTNFETLITEWTKKFSIGSMIVFSYTGYTKTELIYNAGYAFFFRTNLTPNPPIISFSPDSSVIKAARIDKLL